FTMPVCSKLMLIRHAEKPDKDAGIAGVAVAGAPDKDELSVRGWQRAGALVRYFNPRPPAGIAGGLAAGLALPGALLAPAPTAVSPSKRPLHTVKPLAADLGLEVRKDFVEHQEKELLAAALEAAPAVLISWHHERIARI